MKLFIDFEEMTRVFARADRQGRQQLYEHEAYELLSALGSESVPEYLLFTRNQRLTSDALVPFLGDKVVLKVSSPDVVHKSDMEGVAVVPKMAGKVRSGSRRMVDRVSDRYAQFIHANPNHAPDEYRDLDAAEIRERVNKRIQGVLIVQFLPPESDALGNELLVSLRWTRELGMVITAGLGGTDTELYADRFRLGQAVVSASTALVSGEAFFDLFKHTIAYEKCAGLTRGNARLVSDEQLLECFGAFIAVGNYFSPLNPDAPYVIDELEVNPFALVDYEMVPLDGLCRFSKPFRLKKARGVLQMDRLLHPESIAIVGVSGSKMNFGRQILQNIRMAGFDPGKITIVSPRADTIDGVKCVRELSMIQTVDLLVIAVSAAHVPDLIDDIIEHNRAQSVILIPGGMGETESSRERARKMIEKIQSSQDGGPVFLGGNCLGLISRPGLLDTFFVPESCAPKRRETPFSKTALISQSGAFALVRMTEQILGDPAYVVTVGNQMDLTIGDFINCFADAPDIGIIYVYAEGFNDLDGLHACRGIRRAVKNGKEVIIYKSGRTPEGKLATSGHTASVAGDYMVCISCLSQAGALVTESHEDFQGLLNLAPLLHEKQISGHRIAGMSPAGFEAVGIADSLQASDSGLELSEFSTGTIRSISDLFDTSGLSDIMDIRNPLDLTPAAQDHVYIGAMEALFEDDNVDSIVMSVGTLAPGTLGKPSGPDGQGYVAGEGSLVSRLPDLVRSSDKPVVLFNDAGKAHQAVQDYIEGEGVPVYPSCSRAMALLAAYTSYRLRIKNLAGGDKNR
ncbi:MAG: acetate--CoA ligase family protein [Desulfobacterales bacterium]|nr:acetate--CoA ligase family protein [Desulfobacterales bacterium]